MLGLVLRSHGMHPKRGVVPVKFRDTCTLVTLLDAQVKTQSLIETNAVHPEEGTAS